jgi:hypothetical protein
MGLYQCLKPRIAEIGEVVNRNLQFPTPNARSRGVDKVHLESIVVFEIYIERDEMAPGLSSLNDCGFPSTRQRNACYVGSVKHK